ncbi:hypothetical protein V8F33_012626 [Rhypophila sp. PSN 637]
MHRLPPVHFRLFESGLTSPRSSQTEGKRIFEGETIPSFKPSECFYEHLDTASKFEKDLPNALVAAPAPTPAPIPPVSLFPTPVKPVMTHCGWGVPEWGISLSSGFSIYRDDINSIFGDEEYWLNVAFDSWSHFEYTIPTFWTDDESWCPCSVAESSLYGWEGGVHFILQPEGAEYSHDTECHSVISGIVYHNFEYRIVRKELEQIIGAKAMSDVVRPSLESIASRYTPKPSAGAFITLASRPDSLAPTWAWPSTKPDGAVVLPIWRDESYSGRFHAGEFEYDYFNNPITRDENGKTVATRPIFDYGTTSGWQTPPAGLMWWTLPPSRSKSSPSTSTSPADESISSLTSDNCWGNGPSTCVGSSPGSAQTTTEAGSGISPISSSLRPATTPTSFSVTTTVPGNDANTATTGTIALTTDSGNLLSGATQIIPLPAASTDSSRFTDIKNSPKDTDIQLHTTSSQLNRDSDLALGRSHENASSTGISSVDSHSGPGTKPDGPSESPLFSSMPIRPAQFPGSTVTAVTVVITTTYDSTPPDSGLLSTIPHTDPSPPPSGIAISRSLSASTDARYPTPAPLPPGAEPIPPGAGPIPPGVRPIPPGAGPIPPGAEALLFNLRSSADFLMASLIPVLLTTILSMAIQVFCGTLNSLLPFRALTATSHPRLNGTRDGAGARDSLLLPRSNPSSSSLFHGPGVGWRFARQFRDMLPAMNFLLSTTSTILVPLSNEVIRLELTADCGYKDRSSGHMPSEGAASGVPFRRICALGLRKQDTTMRVAESLLVIMAPLVMFMGYMLLRWRSVVAADPWSISAVATLYSGSSPEFRKMVGLASAQSSTALSGCRTNGGGSTHRPLDGELKKGFLAKSEGLKFRLGPFDGNSAHGIEILHPTIKDDKIPIRATTKAPRERTPVKDKMKKTRHYFQRLSSLNPGRMSPGTTRAVMNTTAFILITALLVVILYYENTEVLPSESTGLEGFMSGQSFAVRILFAALGTAITLFWDDYFSYISSTIIHKHLSNPTTKPDFLLHTSPPAHIFDLASIYRTMVKTRDWASLSIALACFLAKFTPILLSNIPFRNTITWEMHEVCTWMAIGVLSYMVLVLGAYCIIPFTGWLKHHFVPCGGRRNGSQKAPAEEKRRTHVSAGMDNIAGLMYYSQVYYKDMVGGIVPKTV